MLKADMICWLLACSIISMKNDLRIADRDAMIAPTTKRVTIGISPFMSRNCSP